MNPLKVPYPPRFRNIEDAELFIDCCNYHTEFPHEKMVFPYIHNGDRIVVNGEYLDAPFELGYFTKEVVKLKLRDITAK